MTASYRLCLYVSPIIIYLIFRYTLPALLQAALCVDKTSFTNAQIKPDSNCYSNVLSQTKIGPSISRWLQVKKTRNHLSDVETVHRPQNDKLSIASSARRPSMLFRISTIESTIRIQQYCCGLYGYRTTTSSLCGSVISSFRGSLRGLCVLNVSGSSTNRAINFLSENFTSYFTPLIFYQGSKSRNRGLGGEVLIAKIQKQEVRPICGQVQSYEGTDSPDSGRVPVCGHICSQNL